jgi:uncharacterized protein (DUF934 family)
VNLHPAPVEWLDLQDWLALRGQPDAPRRAALRLPNDADPAQLAEDLPRLAAVGLQFPKWTDGRAYSQAVLLRSRLRFAGEIRATGEVLADMLPLLRRCGFDAVQLRADQQQATAERALGYFSTHYQSVPPERAPR